MDINKPVPLALIALVLIAGIAYFIASIDAAPADSDMATPSNVATYTDPATGVSFEYPKKFDTEYVSPQGWPPSVEVAIAKLMCAEPLKKINGRDYCIGTETGAAAGSRYTTYTYNTEKGDPSSPEATNGQGRMITVRFTLRYPQCQNYGDPQKNECEAEQRLFNVDTLADQITQSVRF